MNSSSDQTANAEQIVEIYSKLDEIHQIVLTVYAKGIYDCSALHEPNSRDA